MAHINSIEINQFRGIHQLTVYGFSNINLIVGDNNSGKTTFLEALQLVFAKANLGSIKNVINQRTALNASNDSFYTSFIRMFNAEQNKEQLGFYVCAESENELFEFEMRGKEKEITGEAAIQMSSMSSHQKIQYKRAATIVPESAKFFSGSVIASTGGKTLENIIRLTSLDSVISSVQINKEIQYIPSFGHLRYDLLQNIVENPDYKKLVIEIIKKFDDSIVDICYTKADDGTYVETAVTKSGINMPFSVYGDGIKKIMYILNKLFNAADSILLIDEIETGLHKRYYEMMFPVVFELAKQLNVQLFIATHSIEAIDAILNYGHYEDKKYNVDPISVITLRKIDSNVGNNVVARNVTGKYVYDNRKVFEFEVRL